jgi:hypothetical protein
MIQLQEENEDLKEMIRQSDLYLDNFSGKYDNILSSLDSLTHFKDSLQLLSNNGEIYNSDKVDSLEQILMEKQEQIDQLQADVNSGGQSASVSNFLNKELERTKRLISKLERENEKLVSINDSISEQLSSAKVSLTIAQADIVSTNEELRKEREQNDIETRRQLRLVAEREAENRRLRELNKGLASEAEVLYKSAESSLEMLNGLITTDKGKVKVGTGKKRQKFKNLLAAIVSDLSESKAMGYSKANDLLDKIYASDDYVKIRPIGIDY